MERSSRGPNHDACNDGTLVILRLIGERPGTTSDALPIPVRSNTNVYQVRRCGLSLVDIHMGIVAI